MNDLKLEKLLTLIKNERQDNFYHWAEWEKLRKVVLKLDNYECQICKKKGRYRKAVIVHHIKHLKDRPDLALSIWDGEERQLVSLCKQCHRDVHPERLLPYQKEKQQKPLTIERWD